MPLVQLSSFTESAEAETHIRGLKIKNRKDKDQRPLVDMGGGTRTKKPEITGVPVIVHDLLGPGQDARFVSTRSSEAKKTGKKFRKHAPYTGAESALSEVGDVPFPRLLDPIDDHPPATSINWPLPGIPVKLEKDGTLLIRGTTTDDYATKRVTVNGVEARNLDFDFHHWEARIPVEDGGKMFRISAIAEDSAGNVELTPHIIKVEILP
jgi:hypothetical protein